MLQALLILKSLKTSIKIFNILLIFALLIEIVNNIKEVKIIFNINFFLINSCFLLIIFIILFILLFAIRCVI
jgi:hypothetical protein